MIVRAQLLIGAASTMAAVALASTLHGLWSTPIATEPLADGEASVPALIERPLQPMLGLVSFSPSETLSRPVFAPTRRPPEPVAAAPVPIPPQPPELAPTAAPADELRLKGVLIMRSGARALILSPSHQRGRWFRVGSKVDGWKVARITDQSVTMTTPDRLVELKLYVDKPAD